MTKALHISNDQHLEQGTEEICWATW